MDSTSLLLIFVALGAGLLIGWLVAAARTRASYEAKMSSLEAARAAEERSASELRVQLDAARSVESALRAQLEKAETARVAAETALENERKNLLEQKRILEEAERKLLDVFKAAAGDVLTSSQEQFLDRAQASFATLQAQASGDLGKREEAVRRLVDPLQKALEKLQSEIAQVEASRQRAYGDLTRQVEDLKKETGSLVTSLRQPQVKGHWGELTLRRAVELAGMSAHCDFDEQVAVTTEGGKSVRPDMIVHLPGGREIVVDAKAPLHAYAKMDTIQSNEDFQKILEEHARLVRNHVRSLSSTAYWSQLPDTTDFVVLFLPGENFFSGALQKDPALIADAIDRKVILASPTTLIALLRAVAYGWRQQELAENAERISSLGKELYERVTKFMEHMEKLRSGLEKANEAFNSAVGSLEHKLLPGARKFRELGVQTAEEIPDVQPTETALRSLAAAAEEDDA
ncbi:MAG TPA: DNA recombination protein RmuC [Candidatus Nitrosotenuis sp.]|nr:DNA recombination protein RmuC [Candidatus Nitrosotenuis sp.]